MIIIFLFLILIYMVFIQPPILKVNNISIEQSYTEDEDITLRSVYIEDYDLDITLKIKLSDPSAGTLSTPTIDGVTPVFDYINNTAVWKIKGKRELINKIFSTGIIFSPSTNYNKDFEMYFNFSSVRDKVHGIRKMKGIPVSDNFTATNLDAGQTYQRLTPFALIPIEIICPEDEILTVTLSFLSTKGTINVATSGSTTSTFSPGLWTAVGPVTDLNILLSNLIFSPDNSPGIFNINTSISNGTYTLTGVKGMMVP